MKDAPLARDAFVCFVFTKVKSEDSKESEECSQEEEEGLSGDNIYEAEVVTASVL
jgi:hypothetical protein